MKKTILIKKDGEVKVIKWNKEDEKEAKKSNHLCFDCNSSNTCTKYLDVEKETIDKYPQIIDGSQIIDDKGKSDTLLVSKCRDFTYIKSKNRKRTKEELEKVKALTMHYFDALSIEEANQTQEDLYRRGNLTEYRPLTDKGRAKKMKTLALSKSH